MIWVIVYIYFSVFVWAILDVNRYELGLEKDLGYVPYHWRTSDMFFKIVVTLLILFGFPFKLYSTYANYRERKAGMSYR